MASIARKDGHGEDAPYGGALGFVARNDPDLDPNVCKAIYETPIGRLSAPARGRYGYHLVKTLEQKKVTFEQAKADVLHAILTKLRPKLLAEVRKRAARDMQYYVDRLAAPVPSGLKPPTK